MNKTIKKRIWMMAIAIASMTMTACSSDDNETVKPLTTDPVENPTLYASGISQSETRSGTEAQNVLFTENDIEWFDINTREIKFKDMDEPLYKRLQPFHEIEFHLGDATLFVASSFVGLWDSRVFDNLVLCYGNQETAEADGRYYFYDCYPLQYIDTDAVKANREKNAGQWELFSHYLESIGKLKK